MAVRCIRLGCAVVSAISSGVRDPVDRVSCADPFADHGIPSFAQSGERGPRRVRQPSRSLGQIDDARAVGSPQQVDHQRQLAAVPRGDRMGLSADVIWTAANQLSGEMARKFPGLGTMRFARTGTGSEAQIRAELQAGRTPNPDGIV